MKSKAIQSLKLNSVSISNLASINGGLQNNNNNNQPIKGSPSTAGPTWDCGYSNGCKTKGCANG
ncbi:hypothetical protein [uncultured Kordia sp.]|uniref:hypothetical protein n=1 Tax=uncultured Kordia sp. TaxID=507699 RepID=UPI002605B62B|nr:hypothetical protein [uncultured Kordia sp.]